MRIFTEKDAENFLEKEKFNIIKRIHISKESQIKLAINKIGFPLVIKVSGSKIIHKNRVKGIILNIKNYEEAKNAFDKFTKIKGFEGIMIQKQIQGKETLLGIKKTPEFGHVIVFGSGGIHTEELKDISFRVCPVEKSEIKRLISEVKISKELTNLEKLQVEKNILKLCGLVKKYPKIKELDINPLMLKDKNAIIVDARIAWE